MKKSISFLLIGFMLTVGTALGQKMPNVDKSPADIAYYRVDNQPLVKVIYSRPAKKGREIFGKLVPYGKVWRTGANEATEVKFFKDVTFGGKKVKAGTYSLFTIPEKDSWTVILSTQTDIWGAYSYQKSSDVARVKAAVSSTDKAVENFAITFDGPKMIMIWDTTKAEVAIGE